MLAIFPLDSVKAQGEIDGNRIVKAKRFIPLYIGISHDEKLEYLPPGVNYGGDFKKIVSLSVARKMNVLRITPRKVGVATLIVKDKNQRKLYEIRLDVKKSDLTKVVREMRALLSDIDGITIKIVNNRVVVDGKVLLPKDMNRIYAVIKQFGELADTLVELSPLAQKKIAEFIERDINNPEVNVRAVNDKFILEGQVSDKNARDRAEIIAKTYVPDIVVESAEAEGVLKKRKVDAVINLITIKPAPAAPPGKTIQLVVHYVELKKDYERAFRFQWTPDIQDNTEIQFSNDSRSPGGVISTITGIVSNLLPKLNWAKSHGHARVLQSSSMIVQDGQKGDIRSTVKVPYSIIGSNGQAGTNFETTGITSTVTPQIVNPRSDSIQLTTDFSVKSLLGISNAGPLVSENKVNTVITVRSGQSAAIGGLVSNTSTTDFNRLPKNVSANPLISLYASKAFQRNQTQFVVFITPIIKSSASAGSEKIKRKFRLRD
jgi:pilus assembly protein CpaC